MLRFTACLTDFVCRLMPTMAAMTTLVFCDGRTRVIMKDSEHHLSVLHPSQFTVNTFQVLQEFGSIINNTNFTLFLH